MRLGSHRLSRDCGIAIRAQRLSAAPPERQREVVKDAEREGQSKDFIWTEVKGRFRKGGTRTRITRRAPSRELATFQFHKNP